MDETKNAAKEPEIKKKKKKESDEPKTSRIKAFYNDIYGEFKKVIWPSRDDLIKETTTVIITSFLIGGVICGFDYIFGFGYDLLMELVG